MLAELPPCLPEASNATVTRPKSGRLRGRRCCRWARVHPFSPSPYRIVPAPAFCALLPLATVSVIKIKNKYIEKKKEWQFTAQGLALFFPLYYSSYPAASEASMAAVWSLNATGLRLPGCITVFVASLWGGGGIPSPSFLPAGLWTSRFPHSLKTYNAGPALVQRPHIALSSNTNSLLSCLFSYKAIKGKVQLSGGPSTSSVLL